MSRKLCAVAALAAVLAAAPLLAQGPGGHGRGQAGRGPGGPGRGILGMVHQLDLTDAQKQQLYAVMDQQKNGDPGPQIRETEHKLHAAILAEKPDLQAIETAKTAVNSAHAAELDRRVEMMEKVAQILTSVQRSQLSKLQPPGPPR
jgi:Spy/CpxP family protein refolding chaperone